MTEQTAEQAPPTQQEAPAQEELAAGEVVDLTPPTQQEVYAHLSSMFLAICEATAQLVDVAWIVDDERRREIAERAGKTILSVATHVGQLCDLWQDVGDESPPEVAELEEDPGDLTCPRCDGPIRLGELRATGTCSTCRAREIGEAPPPGGGEEGRKLDTSPPRPDADFPASAFSAPREGAGSPDVGPPAPSMAPTPMAEPGATSDPLGEEDADHGA